MIGGAGDEVETHFTNTRYDGSCDLLAGKGGFVHQDSVTPKLLAAFGLSSEPFPNVTHQRGFRTTPDLFGFGLVRREHAMAKHVGGNGLHVVRGDEGATAKEGIGA